ncbi:hypothetical protein [Actinoplanes sp. NPDC049265]|uniref:hypothetical protein n=1 Tax=Actinoplanes sp. NPDC049265 TaxID=3363902 RepID=UPI00371649BB
MSSDRVAENGQNARLLRALVWGGVSLAPVAALVVMLGSSQGPIRFAVLLIAVCVVLVGASLLVRNDPVLLRMQVEDRVAEEVGALREEMRAEIATVSARVRAMPPAPPAPAAAPVAPVPNGPVAAVPPQRSGVGPRSRPGAPPRPGGAPPGGVGAGPSTPVSPSREPGQRTGGRPIPNTGTVVGGPAVGGAAVGGAAVGGAAVGGAAVGGAAVGGGAGVARAARVASAPGWPADPPGWSEPNQSGWSDGDESGWSDEDQSGWSGADEAGGWSEPRGGRGAAQVPPVFSTPAEPTAPGGTYGNPRPARPGPHPPHPGGRPVQGRPPQPGQVAGPGRAPNPPGRAPNPPGRGPNPPGRGPNPPGRAPNPPGRAPNPPGRAAGPGDAGPGVGTGPVPVPGVGAVPVPGVGAVSGPGVGAGPGPGPGVGTVSGPGGGTGSVPGPGRRPPQARPQPAAHRGGEVYGSADRSGEVYGGERSGDIYGAERSGEIYGGERSGEIYAADRSGDIYGDGQPSGDIYSSGSSEAYAGGGGVYGASRGVDDSGALPGGDQGGKRRADVTAVDLGYTGRRSKPDHAAAGDDEDDGYYGNGNYWEAGGFGTVDEGYPGWSEAEERHGKNW